MITKTGIEYSENSDLSDSTTIEENGQQNSITIPSWPTGVELFCQAYVIDDGERIDSSIESYMLQNWFYLKNEYAGQNTITFTCHADYETITFEYSRDKSQWITLSMSTASSPVTITMDEGEKIYMRCENYISSGQTWLTTNCSEIYSIGGNIGTLSHYKRIITPNTGFGPFRFLFQNSTTLVDASDVVFPTNYVGSYAFNGTFSGCSNLRKAPDFSNIVGASYDSFKNAFEGTAIETINMNSLKLINSGIFYCAFQNSSIQTISMDNITNHAGFSNPGLDFYRAFYNCTNLQKGIDLSGFENTGTPAAPDLFKEMYRGCTNLSEATAPKKITDSNNASIIKNWLQGAGTNVSGTKTVYCPTGVTVPTGNSGVPSGWIRADY